MNGGRNLFAGLAVRLACRADGPAGNRIYPDCESVGAVEDIVAIDGLGLEIELITTICSVLGLILRL